MISDTASEKKSLFSIIKKNSVAAISLALLFLLVICAGVQATAFLTEQQNKSSDGVESIEAEIAENNSESLFSTVLANYKDYCNKSVELTGYVSSVIDGDDTIYISFVESRTDVLGFRESDDSDTEQLKQKLSLEMSRLVNKNAVAVFGLNFEDLHPGDRITVSGKLSLKGGRLEIRNAALIE